MQIYKNPGNYYVVIGEGALEEIVFISGNTAVRSACSLSWCPPSKREALG